MKKISKILIFFILLTSSLSSLASNKLCVLNFERRIHPFTKVINDVFGDNEHVILINEALPKDFLQCLKENVSEITIIGHSFQIDKEGKKFKLGYFKEIHGEKRAAAIQEAMDSIEKEIENKDNEYRDNNCKSFNMDKEHDQACKKITNQIRKSKRILKKFANLDEDYPIYDKHIFYNKVFYDSLKFLENQKNQEGEISLKNIRLMSCVPQQALQGHPPLQQLIEKFDIGFELAPKQELISFFKNKYVTTMDKNWLAQSGQFPEENFNEDEFYAYIKLNTFLLFRNGETTALRGKYKITVNGIAAGFARKWSKLYIKRSQIEGMEIAETRILHIPQLDLQLALWLNGEVQIGNHFSIDGTSEINSLGISVGLYEQIEIERIY